MAENKFGVEELGTITRPFIIPGPPLETVRIVSDETELGYMIVNASDFDPATMTVYRATPKKAKA